jgi:hypothetical protein
MPISTPCQYVLALIDVATAALSQRGMENENKLNDNYMRKKLGQVIGFGDVIQVRGILHYDNAVFSF